MANGSQASVRLDGAVAVEQHPAAAPADLVAGAVDDQAAGRQPRPHQRPGLVDRILGVLPQHVERAHQNRAVACQFEAAEAELDGVVRGGPGRVTRSGSISRPITRTSVRTVRSRLANSSVVTGSAP